MEKSMGDFETLQNLKCLEMNIEVGMIAHWVQICKILYFHIPPFENVINFCFQNSRFFLSMRLDIFKMTEIGRRLSMTFFKNSTQGTYISGPMKFLRQIVHIAALI